MLRRSGRWCEFTALVPRRSSQSSRASFDLVIDATSGLGSLATSAGLGLINGLQRQRSGSALPGIRTFPLIAILGTLCAILSDAAGGWVLAAGLASVATATAMGNYLRSIPDRSPGITTEIAIVGPGVFWAMSQRLVVILAPGILVAIVLWARTRRAVATNRGPSNPSNLRSALVFAGLFTVVSVLVAVARREFGDAGLQLVAMVSGLTDMDAITLNTARLAQEGTLDPGTAGRVVLLASVTNLMFKGVIVGVLGGWGLLRRLVVPMGVLIAIGAALAMA